MSGSRGALAALVVLCAAPSARADGGEGEPISLETLLDTVVTATLRMQSTLEAPASISVVSASEIRARGYRTLKAVMNDVPGFNDVADINEEIVAVRGVYASTTNKILILVNGHRMNDLMLGRYNVDQFLGMDAVDRVEFIRGPASALYGTGALVGVVNVITKRGAALDGTQLRLQGGPSAQEASLTWGKPLLGYDVLFNFTFLNAPGQTVQQPARLDVPPPDRPAQAGQVYLGRYRENLSGIVTLRSDTSSVALRAAHFRRTTPRAMNGSFYDLASEPYKPTYTENDFFVDYSYRVPLGSSGKTQLTINPSVHFFSYFEQSVITYGADRVPPVGVRGSHQDEFNNYQLKLTLEHPLRDDLDLIAGFDGILASFYRSDAVVVKNDALVLIPEGNTTTGSWFLGGAFLQTVYAPWRPLTLTLGARYDTFQGEARPTLTPRIGVVWKPLPAVALKGLYGRSYLAPMWAHKRANDGIFFGNPDLGPESFQAFDLIAAYGDRRGSATVDVFYNQVDGLINSAPNPETATLRYQNAPGTSCYVGAEAAAEGQVAAVLRLQGSYSLMERGPCPARPCDPNTSGDACQRIADPALIGDRIKDIPTHTFRYGLRVEPRPALVISLCGRATTRIRTVDPVAAPGSAYVTLPPVALLDASVMYTWRDLTFQLVATNLTDRRYELGGTVPRPLPGPGLDLQAALLWRL